jgi:hypothetical protein
LEYFIVLEITQFIEQITTFFCPIIWVEHCVSPFLQNRCAKNVESSHLFFPTRLHLCDLLIMEWVTMGKPDINSVEVHAQLSNNRHHPVDGVLVGQVYSGPLFVLTLSLVVHGSHEYTLRIDWTI